MTRVYVDIVGDLFHAGHVAFLESARQFGDTLVVGVHGDEDVAGYKRLPILTMDERLKVVSACSLVDEVIPSAPLVIDQSFLDHHSIDIVVHGDDIESDSYLKFYGLPAELGMMRLVPYTSGISTTEILERIQARSQVTPPDTGHHGRVKDRADDDK